MFQVTLHIEGMACGMCEAHVNDAIRNCIPDAKKVKSSHRKGICTFRTETAPDMDILKEAINRTGYTYLEGTVEPG